jgi:hypothetical protein
VVIPLLLLTSLAGTAAGQAAPAGAGCSAYTANLQTEFAAIASPPIPVSAAGTASTAPGLARGRAAEVRLVRQLDTTFAHPPERQRGGPDSYAGIVSLGVLPAGRWRISMNKAVWVDLVAGGKLLASPDFEMRAQCPEIVKSVVFEQAVGGLTLLQISGGEVPAVRVVVTEASAPTARRP